MASNINDTSVSDILAALAVSDLEISIEWLSKVLGQRESARPMDGLAEWYLGAAGTLQLALDADRAGGGMVTLVVTDIAATRDRLADVGIRLEYDETTSEEVKFAQLLDPDGNSVTVAEAK